MITKVLNIILMLIIVMALALPYGLFVLKELEKSHRVKAEEMLWQERLAEKKAGKHLSSLKEESDYIMKELIKNRKEAESLESELVGYKGRLSSIRQKITDIDNKTASSERKMIALRSDIKDIKVKIISAAQDTLKFTEELVLLQKTTGALRERLAQFLEEEKGKQKISMKGSGAVRPQPDMFEETQQLEGTAQAAPEPSLMGEVLIVNREFDFVVVNLGQEDGIEEGMVLDVARDDNILGQAIVETVRTNTSAAGIIDKDIIYKVRAGDKALLYPPVR